MIKIRNLPKIESDKFLIYFSKLDKEFQGYRISKDPNHRSIFFSTTLYAYAIEHWQEYLVHE